jgi:hypothetical protein
VQIRLLVPSATGVVIGVQMIFGSFLLGIPTLKLNRAPATFVELHADEPASDAAAGASAI